MSEYVLDNYYIKCICSNLSSKSTIRAKLTAHTISFSFSCIINNPNLKSVLFRIFIGVPNHKIEAYYQFPNVDLPNFLPEK